MMGFIVHNDDIFVIIYCECSDGVACMVRKCNVLVVREDYQILRIIAADRKVKLLLKESCLCINLIHGNRILSGSCTEQMPAVRCKCKSGCRIVNRILVIRLSECADTLEQFKLRSTAASVIAVNLDLIAQFKQDICKSAVCTETDDPRTALSRSTSSSLCCLLLMR